MPKTVGWGRVEQAIAEALAVPGSAYTTEELVEIVYDWRKYQPEKKHRVAVLRAAKRLCERDRRYSWFHRGGTGAQFVFFDHTSFESYKAAMPKAFGRYMAEATHPFSKERLDAVGGLWWQRVEQWRAELAGDTEAAARIAAEQQAEHERTMQVAMAMGAASRA